MTFWSSFQCDRAFFWKRGGENYAFRASKATASPIKTAHLELLTEKTLELPWIAGTQSPNKKQRPRTRPLLSIAKCAALFADNVVPRFVFLHSLASALGRFHSFMLYMPVSNLCIMVLVVGHSLTLLLRRGVSVQIKSFYHNNLFPLHRRDGRFEKRVVLTPCICDEWRSMLPAF